MMSLVSRRKETEVGGSSTSGKGGPSLPAARGPVPKACTVGHHRALLRPHHIYRTAHRLEIGILHKAGRMPALWSRGCLRNGVQLVQLR